MATILALDDIQDAANLVKRILEKMGHTVYPFTEEEEAISFAASNPVDLAVLDIKLARMSGVEVLAELKRMQPAMKAIMLTGYPTVETERECIRLGAGAYCVKPMDKEELEGKVAEVLGLA